MPGRGSLGYIHGRTVLSRAVAGVGSWGHRADAGAVAIRVFGEGVVPLRLPPHISSRLAILIARPARITPSSTGREPGAPREW
jgi:hypothetical protein